MERQTNAKGRKFLRPAYVRIGGSINCVTMRSLSSSGAIFSGISALAVGDLVTYCHDGLNLTDANVRWINGDTFGVENLAADSLVHARITQAYPYRTIRIPINSICKIYSRGRELETRLYNLSISGAAINDLGLLSLGDLISLEIGNRVFEAVTVKWLDSNRAGLRFSSRLTVREVHALAQSLQANDSNESEVEPLAGPTR